ncbi:MAG: DNA polymerase III subunit gamma/tau [Campylobacterales bacterium]|nr:DNA polymerase III subunit gamma/tau [Campylobacterales bacterium]
MKASSEVLARKYRPKNFDELIGQETIAQTLSLALDANRLSHAYLFSGLRGSGKTSTARIFAKALICEEGMSHQPCGVCSNCTMAIEGRHMDIIEMDGASSRKIDDIRDLVEQTKYKPAVARYKIFIIDEVHMLTKEAFNALLKTLEEPPEYVKFILATTDPLKLPATILSRTQHFRFKSIAPNKIVEHLMHILHLEGIEYEHEALEILARSGSGSLRDTLTLLDQAIIYSKNHVDVRTVTDMLGLVDPQFLANIFNAVFAKDYAQIVAYTKELEDYESEMVVDELIAYLKERMYNQDALFSTLVLERFFRILSDAKYLFSVNADGSFVLSLIFFKMVEALKVREIDQMIESLQKEVEHTDIQTLQSSKPLIQESPQENKITPPKVKIHSTTPEMAPKETPSHTPVEEELTPIKPIDPYLKKFEHLVAKIGDRNAQLGECFANNISYVSYENETLTWESCADEECKKALKHGYGVIKQLVREIFSFETKIKGVVCSKTDSNDEPEELQISEQESPTTIAETPVQTQTELQPQATTMIEEAETGIGSCVTNCAEQTPIEKQNGTDITQEPMVQKAIEMFEAKKITVQSKI